ILTAVKDLGLEDNTLLVFTSDHGDLLGSHGQKNKQQPYEESILVPMVLRFPALFGRQKREVKTLINTPDLMPTLLGLCGIASPEGVEGTDFSEDLKSGKDRLIDGALIMCAAPFGQWQRSMGGREYRGIRTERYTYVRDLKGPWLLFDNQADPFQKKNLAGMAEYRSLRDQLEEKLRGLLEQTRDSFEPADQLLARWGYQVDETGTIPYKN
ncbi:MAG: sulfatase-like hydrolase/transferase, partial [Candidatus Omnitrophica bacterium]|nr:sulfatase-like hydrolase/transferase [Candidatus Omnitrophota bacterium]